MGFHLDLLEKTHAEFRSIYGAPNSVLEFAKWRTSANPFVGRSLYNFVGVASSVPSVYTFPAPVIITRILGHVIGTAGTDRATVAIEGFVAVFEPGQTDIKELYLPVETIEYNHDGAPDVQIYLFGYTPASV